MTFSDIKYVVLGLAALALGGCAGLTGPVIMGTDAAVIYVTKPDGLPPADTKDQIVAHESWCYSTAGEPQCFAHPQDVAPERLINVDPQSAYPIDLAAYHQALIAKPVVVPAAALGAPTVLDPAAPVTAPAAVSVTPDPTAPYADEQIENNDLKKAVHQRDGTSQRDISSP